MKIEVNNIMDYQVYVKALIRKNIKREKNTKVLEAIIMASFHNGQKMNRDGKLYLEIKDKE